MAGPTSVEIVEVGPRDGYQGIVPFIQTGTKIEFLKRLVATGIRRIEIGSFVSPSALPQMRDTSEVLRACVAIGDLIPQVLVPTEKWGRTALEKGARFLVYVLSASEAHNRSNVRRHPLESAEDYRLLVGHLPAGVDLRLDIATAFDCPFEGRLPIAATLALLDRLVPLRPGAEICLCDTTGRADPGHVEDLFAAALDRFPEVTRWALHAHDTYGLGLANVHAAWRMGIRVFDASFAGLGGCPFAPGASGNVATEDLVWMFGRMGVETGIDLDRLVRVACDGAAIPGSLSGGRARQVLSVVR